MQGCIVCSLKADLSLCMSWAGTLDMDEGVIPLVIEGCNSRPICHVSAA